MALMVTNVISILLRVCLPIVPKGAPFPKMFFFFCIKKVFEFADKHKFSDSSQRFFTITTDSMHDR